MRLSDVGFFKIGHIIVFLQIHDIIPVSNASCNIAIIGGFLSAAIKEASIDREIVFKFVDFLAQFHMF